MKKTIVCLSLAFGLALPVVATGEPRAPAKRPAVKAKQSRSATTQATVVRTAPRRLIFEDDVVKAGRAGGGGTMVKGRVAPKHSQLIPIRTDFLPELLKSAEDV
jgi:hypothetical protein